MKDYEACHCCGNPPLAVRISRERRVPGIKTPTQANLMMKDVTPRRAPKASIEIDRAMPGLCIPDQSTTFGVV